MFCMDKCHSGLLVILLDFCSELNNSITPHQRNKAIRKKLYAHEILLQIILKNKMDK